MNTDEETPNSLKAELQPLNSNRLSKFEAVLDEH